MKPLFVILVGFSSFYSVTLWRGHVRTHYCIFLVCITLKKLEVVLGEMSGHLGESFGRKKSFPNDFSQKVSQTVFSQNVGILVNDYSH